VFEAKGNGMMVYFKQLEFQNCDVVLKKSRCSVHFSSSFSVNTLVKPGCGACVGVLA